MCHTAEENYSKLLSSLLYHISPVVLRKYRYGRKSKKIVTTKPIVTTNRESYTQNRALNTVIILRISPLTRWMAQCLETRPCALPASPWLPWAPPPQGAQQCCAGQCSAPWKKPGLHRAVSHVVLDLDLPPSLRPAPSALPPSR